MMKCKEAMVIMKEWGETEIRGKEPKGSSGDIHEAFEHIRECREEKCSQLWREFNLILRGLEGVELLYDEEDGTLVFSH